MNVLLKFDFRDLKNPKLMPERNHSDAQGY